MQIQHQLELFNIKCPVLINGCHRLEAGEKSADFICQVTEIGLYSTNIFIVTIKMFHFEFPSNKYI